MKLAATKSVANAYHAHTPAKMTDCNAAMILFNASGRLGAGQFHTPVTGYGTQQKELTASLNFRIDRTDLITHIVPAPTRHVRAPALKGERRATATRP